MNPPDSTTTRAEARLGDTRILYNPSRMTAISREWFESGFWDLRGAVRDRFQGRGEALAVETPDGPAVLRCYRRGGWVARFVSDRYCFTSYQNSRAFQEFSVLQQLHADGLPVPEPLAALCDRRGPSYRAALMMEEIQDSRTLADCAERLTDQDWSDLRTMLGRFFRAGVEHVDLNARNVLRDQTGRWVLIDFDRARIHPSPRTPHRMLRRLWRSLVKLDLDLEPSVLGL